MSESNASTPVPQGSSSLRPKAREALKAARAVFLETGYDGATMDAIARVGAISKATLYAHFSSKAVLFEELIRIECRAVNARLYEPDPQNASVEAELRKVATNYRRIFTQREGLDIFRILVPVAPRFPGLAKVFYEEGPGASIRQIATYLAALSRAGRVRIPDPDLAAHQFLALVAEDTKLAGALAFPPPRAYEADQLIGCGIAMFLDFYKA
ncbi:TetR/AcrR family transcriptional regulator [Xanthobacter agilis]|jgi:AcrR family transcriptional regulator|uniref:AcrR family transcriptional regulator n=1 Tax=Xanthobacter agilis TaxID=47492 RepID=A0ABU0LFA5_XANAG|nr:TetR/AcrR family transcriptional regulator [Xanthobacter agilis]MDQ0505818.1 AcrR family transcriptional regulator [Xanthobacter agilis]